MKSIVTVALVLLLAGCVAIPPDAFKLPPSSLADRQMQSRVFATTDHTLLLASSVSVLQDLGYVLDATNSRLGMLTASKEISAQNATQIIGLVLLAAFTGQSGSADEKQKIRICLVVNRLPNDSAASVARITIQRIVSNDVGMVTAVTQITEPALYQTFFDKLAKAAFLEANAA